MIGLVVILGVLVQASLGFYVPYRKAAACSITLSNLDPEPIVVSKDGYQFLYPAPGQTSIDLTSSDTILISCPGGTLTVGSNSYTTVEATCVSGSQLSADGQTVNFNNIKCSRNPFHTARYTGASCESNGKQVEIGFVLDDDRFARQILICFDSVNQNSLYSTYNLTKSIGAHESGVDRPSFIQDDFYNVGGSVNELYTQATQRVTINSLVGLSSGSTKYVASGDFFLSRGHLTAKAAFVFAPQQLATFHYINVAPQWQTFNGRNWNTLEMDVRDYADANELDLVVYTGTYGVSTLPHEDTGADIPLYLYVSENNRGIPVPEVYWKAVHDPLNRKGVVIIGINNPYQTDVEKSIFCTDISSTVNWLTFDLKDRESGYSYACAIDDFRETVDYWPNIDVSGGVLL